MAIINAGGFAQVSVPLGYALSISGSARVYVAPPRPASMDGGPFVVNDPDVIGPFPVAVTLNIEAAGTVSYSVVMSPLVGDPVVSQTDPATGAVSLVSPDGNSHALLDSLVRVDLRMYNAVPFAKTAEAAAANHAAMTAALAALPEGGTIVISEPYFFSNNYFCNRRVFFEGASDAAAITYVPASASGAWFTWSREGAPASQLNEEGQLVAAGVSRMSFFSDRSIPAGALRFVGCDRALLHFSYAEGFKGRSLELQNTREIVGGGWSTRYCGRYDSDPALCREDILIASTALPALDTSNLNLIDKFSSVFPFWHNLVFDDAPQNTILSYLLHVLARGNTSLESNFCAKFGGSPGWDASGNPLNEFASLHAGAPSVASVSGRMWKTAFAKQRALLVKGGSYETRIGSGRMIGGNTLAVAEVTGSSIVSINDTAIESAGAFIGTFAANAGTDIMTIGAVQAGSTCDVLPEAGTPLRLTTTGTLPAPLETGLDYYLIPLTVGTFKLANTYADAVAETPVPIDLADTGSGTHTVYAGGHPLLVTDNSIANVTEKTYINNGRVAVFRDETSQIYGLGRTGATFVQGARHPTNTGEIKLFELRRARLDLTTDQAFKKVFSGGVRYKISRIVAVLRNAKSAAAAVGGIYTAAAKGGQQVVANSQTYTPLAAENAVRTLTLNTYANDTNMADGTFSGSVLYLSLTTPSANASVADFYIYGTVMD